MSEVDQQIEALRNLSTAKLRDEWPRVWKDRAPMLGHDLPRRGIAWKTAETGVRWPAARDEKGA